MDKKIVAHVYVTNEDRVVKIGKKRHYVGEEAMDADPTLENLLEKDEEAFNVALDTFEQNLLRDAGVTHVISFQTFGDDEERPIEEYL